MQRTKMQRFYHACQDTLKPCLADILEELCYSVVVVEYAAKDE